MTEAEQQFASMVDLMRKTSVKVTDTYLHEVAEIVANNSPQEADRILNNIRKEREAKRNEDFYKYTHNSCGCYQDPGGHP